MKFTRIFLIIFLLISCDTESEFELGDYYFKLGMGPNSSIVKKDHLQIGVYNIILSGEITSYSFNQEFILIFRTASKEAKLYSSFDTIWNKQNNRDTLQFWIIRKDIDKLYGPFKLQEYLQKRVEYKIPKDLKVGV